MSGKSKACDQTNLDTGAAPINLLVQSFVVKLKFTILVGGCEPWTRLISLWIFGGARVDYGMPAFIGY